MARSPKATATDILAKFPGPIVLYPSKLHLVHLFIVGVFFFVFGVSDLYYATSATSAFERAVAIGSAIMGGLSAPMFALAFLPKAAFLLLDGAGFEYANCFYKRRYAWGGVKDFGVGVLSYGVRMVSFKAPWHHHFLTTYLPDSYGFTVDETSALMSSWQNLATPSVSPEPALNNRPLPGRHADNVGRLLVRNAEKLGRMFAHVTALQWIGMAIIGLSFVAALTVFFISI